jgi:DNA-nicking Smr family endonuclease
MANKYPPPAKKAPMAGTKAQMPTLDLHGFTTDAVADAVDRFLVKSQKSGHHRVRIITGKGTGAVRKVALDWLKLGGFPYSAENEGSYIIFLED